MQAYVCSQQTAENRIYNSFFDQKTPIDSPLPERESPHIVHAFKEYFYRVPDEEFKEKATIEIVYICDDSSGIAHFLFLRRLLCDDTPLASRNRPVSLRDVLKRESRFPLHIASPQPNPKKRKETDSTIEKQSSDKRRRTKSASKQDVEREKQGQSKNSTNILQSVVEQIETPERTQLPDRRRKDVPNQQQTEVQQAIEQATVDSIVEHTHENEPKLASAGQVESRRKLAPPQQQLESDRAIVPTVEATFDSVDEQSGEIEPTLDSGGRSKTFVGNELREGANDTALEATNNSVHDQRYSVAAGLIW